MSKRLPIARSTAETERAEATRPGLHRTHIALLAQSRHRVVREAIARRDDVPLGIQAALANDDWWEVRAAVAANPRAATSVMDSLAEDRHHAVLLALIGNPNLEAAIAIRLGQHRRQDVREAMAERMRTAPIVERTHPQAEDHLIPELRERATPWADGAVVASEGAEPLSEHPIDMVDAEQAATLGAAARAAAPQTRDSLMSVSELEAEDRVAVFEPGPDDPLDAFESPAGITAHAGHDFLVVTLPDDLGPTRPGAAYRSGVAAPMRTFTRTH